METPAYEMFTNPRQGTDSAPSYTVMQADPLNEILISFVVVFFVL